MSSPVHRQGAVLPGKSPCLLFLRSFYCPLYNTNNIPVHNFRCPFPISTPYRWSGHSLFASPQKRCRCRPTGYVSPADLPHDWLIYDTKNLYEDSIGWYRKKFVYSTSGTKCGKRVILRFEGVYMDSEICVNGTKLGEWKYGYSTFDWDITDSLREGENEVVLRVVFQSPNSRWYSGAGIYRNVWMICLPETHI